jgi:hypothetical protein
MRTNDENRNRTPPGVPEHPERTASVAGVAIGGVVGLALGALAGPVGLAIGALAGAGAGAAATGFARKKWQRDDRKNARLDAVIGVSGGDMGAAPPGPPPPTGGTYSAASSGSAGLGTGATPDAGPMPRGG